MPEVTDDYVSSLRAFCTEWLKQNQGCDLIDHGFGPERGGELTTVKLAAMLDELERLREFESAIGKAQVSLLVGAFERGWWKGSKARSATGVYTQALLDVTEYANEICALNADAAPQQPGHAGESR